MSDVAAGPRRKLSLMPTLPTRLSRTDALRAELRTLDESLARARFELGSADARALKTTISLCPQCLEHVPALVYAREGRVLARKRCETHGLSDAVLENDERFYYLSSKDSSGQRFADLPVFDIPAFALPGAASCCGEGETCGPSTDQMSNKTCTILVEVTNACNLACPVCYSDAKGDRKMPLDTFKRYVTRLIEQKGGLDSIQLTGGEALLHPEFWEMIAFVHAQPGVKKIYLPTNGILLARREVADRLTPFASKLMVLLQFDGLRDQTDRTLRASTPGKVRLGVVADLQKRGIPMQLTMTIAAGVNDDEIGDVVEVGLRHSQIKVIALQPVTYSGRYELEREAMNRSTLSDIAKAVVSQTRIRMQDSDFVPIPCSHPNCGWITLFVRRFGLTRNIIRYVDLPKIVADVAYKTLLSTSELKGALGSARGSLMKRTASWVARRVVRSTDVFTIAIKPFMDKHSYDQDRIANCCHHLMDARGVPTSFCEYNALTRPGDSWANFPTLS